MDTVKTTIGQGGRVVLPAKFRKSLGVNPGDEVIVALGEGELRIFTRLEAIKRAQGLLRQYIPEGRSLVDELIQERRAEAARE